MYHETKNANKSRLLLSNSTIYTLFITTLGVTITTFMYRNSSLCLCTVEGQRAGERSEKS